MVTRQLGLGRVQGCSVWKCSWGEHADRGDLYTDCCGLVVPLPRLMLVPDDSPTDPALPERPVVVGGPDVGRELYPPPGLGLGLGSLCARCGAASQPGARTCGCGFPLAAAAPPRSSAEWSLAPATTSHPHSTAGALPVFHTKPQPDDGPLVLALVAAALITFVILVAFVLIEFLMVTGGNTVDSGAVVGAVVIGILGLVGSVFVQVQITILLMEKWTKFTIPFWTEFWICMVALLAEVVCGFLGPLAIGVAVAVQWWLTKDRATPVGGVQTP